MAITPQAIKDQEFQVKFRGYDAIEVKAYLELIAEEFFELSEQVRKQAEDIESLNTSLLQEIGDLKGSIAGLEREGKDKDEELRAEVQRTLTERELLDVVKREKEDLNARFTALERQWDEQNKVEIDFKDALFAVQTFSRDLKKRSEEEADGILKKAREEAEKLRRDTYEELVRYPKEIKRLKKKYIQVREELRAVLTLGLENLDIFKEETNEPEDIFKEENEPEEEDYSDLFQSIMVSGDGTADSEEMAKLDKDTDLLDSFHAAPQPAAADPHVIEPADDNRTAS